jgi:hypothetical protein
MPTLTTNGTGRHSASYDSLGTLQMLEVAKGILPREYSSWDEINRKVPVEWRDGKAAEITEQNLLRSPAVYDSTGGAISDKQAKERNRMLKVADQAVTLAFENGLPVSESIATSLLPTPTTASSQRNSRGAVTHPTKPSGVQLEQAIELAQGILPREFESWDEVSASYLPTPAARDGKDGTGERIRDGVVQTDSVARAVLSSGEITLLGTPGTSSSNGSTAKERANGALKGR